MSSQVRRWMEYSSFGGNPLNNQKCSITVVKLLAKKVGEDSKRSRTTLKDLIDASLGMAHERDWRVPMRKMPRQLSDCHVCFKHKRLPGSQPI